jgi:hypothetical protein
LKSVIGTNTIWANQQHEVGARTCRKAHRRLATILLIGSSVDFVQSAARLSDRIHRQSIRMKDKTFGRTFNIQWPAIFSLFTLVGNNRKGLFVPLPISTDACQQHFKASQVAFLPAAGIFCLIFEIVIAFALFEQLRAAGFQFANGIAALLASFQIVFFRGSSLGNQQSRSICLLLGSGGLGFHGIEIAFDSFTPRQCFFTGILFNGFIVFLQIPDFFFMGSTGGIVISLSARFTTGARRLFGPAVEDQQ